MEYLVSGIKNFFIRQQNEEKSYKKQITGYILNNQNSEKIYVLAKEGEYCWRTIYVDKDTDIITPSNPIRSVFCP